MDLVFVPVVKGGGRWGAWLVALLPVMALPVVVAAQDNRALERGFRQRAGAVVAEHASRRGEAAGWNAIAAALHRKKRGGVGFAADVGVAARAVGGHVLAVSGDRGDVQRSGAVDGGGAAGAADAGGRTCRTGVTRRTTGCSITRRSIWRRRCIRARGAEGGSRASRAGEPAREPGVDLPLDGPDG